jgi:hypothetical protein
MAGKAYDEKELPQVISTLGKAFELQRNACPKVQQASIGASRTLRSPLPAQAPMHIQRLADLLSSSFSM